MNKSWIVYKSKLDKTKFVNQDYSNYQYFYNYYKKKKDYNKILFYIIKMLESSAYFSKNELNEFKFIIQEYNSKQILKNQINLQLNLKSNKQPILKATITNFKIQINNPIYLIRNKIIEIDKQKEKLQNKFKKELLLNVEFYKFYNIIFVIRK